MIDMLKGSSGRRQVFLVALFTTIISAQGGSADCASLPEIAQSATATLSRTTLDESGAAVSEVRITAARVDTGTIYLTTTNANGYFAIALLPPGRYKVTARRQGFATVDINDVLLNVNDQRALTIQLKLGELKEGITIEGVPVIQTESASVSTIVDRQFVENLPLNGRSFQTLIELTAGTVLTKSNYAEQGQFSVNGQRDNANYFMIDGVSANVGIGNGISLVQTAGGTVPAFTALGGTNNLVSVDALQEFRIQTSTYAPEFGRMSGAQVSIATRSGTNQFHGVLFDYFRNDALDANDWFANNLGLLKPPLRQNDFGGVVGGPILKDRTFFFFSYEGLRLRLPQVAIWQVPSLETRRKAVAGVQPLLNAYPLPNSRDLGSGFAELDAAYADPSNLDALSIRGDHTIGSKLMFFGRYNYAPSNQLVRTLSSLAEGSFKTETLTLGSTHTVTAGISNDVRVNYSRTRGAGSFSLDQFGGAVVPPDSVLFPSFVTQNHALINFSVGSSSLWAGTNADNLQRQINVVDGLSIITGDHQLKVGIDYRRLFPISDRSVYNLGVGFENADAAISGIASFVSVGGGTGLGRLFPVFSSLSAYAQDTWKATHRITLTYGLRWELNPPPPERNGNDPFTIIGLENPATARLAPQGTPLWEAKYDNFAPRLGAAYHLFQSRGRETVLRGGFGIFYDLGTGPAGNVFWGGYPLSSGRILSNVAFPLTAEQSAPGVPMLTVPYRLFVIDPDHTLPRTYQWNFSVEQSLGSNQTISVSYVAAVGRDLLRKVFLRGASLANPSFISVTLIENSGTSDYHSLQAQYQRRLSNGLQALGSYTWSHSIDNASTELATNVPASKIAPDLNRGPSDFDVRHSFSAALTYDIRPPELERRLDVFLRDWSVDAMFRARTATPVDVTVNRPLFGIFGILGAARPDRVPGVPLYIDDPASAGGRRFNPAAFSLPPLEQQGTLGHNSLRGFPVYQLDLALRRGFSLTDHINLQFRTDFFNIFNHPNFADPEGSLSSGAFFGRSLEMLGQSLSNGAGLSPLYQIGGPRSIQLALRLQF